MSPILFRQMYRPSFSEFLLLLLSQYGSLLYEKELSKNDRWSKDGLVLFLSGYEDH